LPEQLDDLLAPDLGLDGEPVEQQQDNELTLGRNAVVAAETRGISSVCRCRP
jgi:hypothetical protein